MIAASTVETPTQQDTPCSTALDSEAFASSQRTTPHCDPAKCD